MGEHDRLSQNLAVARSRGRRVRLLRSAWDALLFTAPDKLASTSTALQQECAGIAYDFQSAQLGLQAKRLTACVHELVKTSCIVGIVRVLLLLRDGHHAAPPRHRQLPLPAANEAVDRWSRARNSPLTTLPKQRHPDRILVLYAMLGVPVDVSTLDRSVRCGLPGILAAGRQFQCLKALIAQCTALTTSLFEDPLQGFYEQVDGVLSEVMSAVTECCLGSRRVSSTSSRPGSVHIARPSARLSQFGTALGGDAVVAQGLPEALSVLELLVLLRPLVRRLDDLFRICVSIAVEQDDAALEMANRISQGVATSSDTSPWLGFPRGLTLVARLHAKCRSAWAGCSLQAAQVPLFVSVRPCSAMHAYV